MIEQLTEKVEVAIRAGWRAEQNIGFIEVLKDGDYRFHVEIDGQDDTIVLTPMEVFHEIISFI